MKLTKIDSSAIEKLEYDRETGELGVVFKRDPDKLYIYPGISERTMEMLKPGESVGVWFNKYVRG